MNKMRIAVMLLMLSLLVSACVPSLWREVRGQLGETPTLRGKAENWLGRALTIKLALRQYPSKVIDFVGSGTVDAAGNFSIILPGVTPMQPYLVPSLLGYQTISPPCARLEIDPSSTKISYALNLAVFDGGLKVGQITLEPNKFDSPGDVFAALLFVDQDVDWNIICSEADLTNHLHSRILKGWFYDINEYYTTGQAHEYVDWLPSSIRWTFAATP
jgi:hypothetical protein